jgi:hypothetical protein
MSEFEFYAYDIAIDDGRGIDSFLEEPRQNQYIEQIVNLTLFNKMKRLAKDNEQVNVIELAQAGSEYIIRGDRSSTNPRVPKGHVWIVIATVDYKSLEAFNEKIASTKNKK